MPAKKMTVSTLPLLKTTTSRKMAIDPLALLKSAEIRYAFERSACFGNGISTAVRFVIPLPAPLANSWARHFGSFGWTTLLYAVRPWAAVLKIDVDDETNAPLGAVSCGEFASPFSV